MGEVGQLTDQRPEGLHGDLLSEEHRARSPLQVLSLRCQRHLVSHASLQIAATERILWKIRGAYEGKNWGKTESGGYIWHTTGSGKTLTSFKAAQIATTLDFIDKVFFVVDRKDLDYQTMKEYQRFSPDSVNGSDSTAG
ncbi:DEAD/DEAH box helicase family protein [Rubritalea tangerina]